MRGAALILPALPRFGNNGGGNGGMMGGCSTYLEICIIGLVKKISTSPTGKAFLGLLAGLLFCARARADTIDKLSDLEGYFVLKVKTIDGWMDKDKKQKKSGFEGCDWDRVIIFDDGTTASCRTYSYTYSYRPKAALFVKPMTHNGTNFFSIKMLVGSDIYDMGVQLSK